MSRYAQGTHVSVDASLTEIKRCVRRFGATEFGFHESDQQAIVGFVMHNLRFEFSVPMPDRKALRHTPTGRARAKSIVDQEFERELRRRWRALKEVIKALLIAVQEDILRLEEAFMPYIVTGNGRTVAANLLPKIKEARESGNLPSAMMQKAVPLLEANP